MPNRDPKKDEFIEHVASSFHRTNGVGWNVMAFAGLLVVAFGFVSWKQMTTTTAIRASILQATPESQERVDQAIRAVRSTVGFYDSGKWRAVENPLNPGVIVVMSEHFLWYVEENGDIFVINGLAKTITDRFSYTTVITPERALAILGETPTEAQSR